MTRTRSARTFRALALVLIAATMLVSTAIAQTIPNNVTIRNFFKVGTDSLTFNRPLMVKPYPAEDSAFIVLQQSGQIVTVRWNGTAWRKTDSASVTVMGGTNGIDEQGLLGFAFHPNYMLNGKYYVYFVAGSGGFNGQRFNMIAERTAGSSFRPATADAQRTIFRITDPYDNHNAGTLGFDTEGHLVFAIGDGGTVQGDPQNRAQNPDSLHGKFLRIDVNSDAYPNDTTRNYAIPSTNPYKDSANVRPEIWARGMRNPWKWSFHPVTGEIWVGDVGQDTWEEVSRVPKGANLGWKIREGNACYPTSTTSCVSAGLNRPALVLPHSAASCITGGTFFTGHSTSQFNGTYIFGDHGTHTVWAARVQNDSLVNLTAIGSVNKVASFDRDRQGRVLATSISPTTTFQINNNIGRVLVLESPDMNLSTTSLRPRVSTRLGTLSLNSILANRTKYELTHVDGSVIVGVPDGVFLVRERGRDGRATGPAQLMSTIGL